MAKTSKDSTATSWDSIVWDASGTSSTTNVDTNFTINDKKLRKDLEGIYMDFKKTDREVNAGRKVRNCRRCSGAYYEDEGISDGFCSLDCKYFLCIIEEEKDGQNL